MNLTVDQFGHCC